MADDEKQEDEDYDIELNLPEFNKSHEDGADGNGCGCRKPILFTFNVLYVIAGVALFFCGAVVRFGLLVGHHYMAIALIVVGCCIIATVVIGCCGVLKDKPLVLNIFGVLVVAVIIFCAYGASFLGQKSNAEKDATALIGVYFTRYSDSYLAAERTDYYQREFQCCGVHKYTSWSNNAHFSNTNSVPDSCCKHESTGCGALAYPEDISNIYKYGCVSPIRKEIQRSYSYIGAGSAAVGSIMLIGIIISACLDKNIRQGYMVAVKIYKAVRDKCCESDESE